MKLRCSSALLLTLVAVLVAAGFFLLGMRVSGAAFGNTGRMAGLLILASGGVVLVTAVAILVLANPLRRLLDRVGRIQLGDNLCEEEFTRNLHAEPLALARRIREIFGGFASQAKTDHLTGLSNRRQFDAELERAFLDAQRFNRPLSLILLDVDLFKAINDTAGHQAGDDLLKAVANVMVSCGRKTDLPARLGGDEFAILLPGTSATSGTVVAERILTGVRKQEVVLNGERVNTTASIGIADLNSGQIHSARDLFALADRAMYEAKKQGRNRFVQSHVLEEAEAGDGRAQNRMTHLKESLASLDAQFKSLFVRALQDVVATMERRDPHMADHARKVRQYAKLIAREMALPEQIVQRVELTALLHDVGMLALPDDIVLCTGRLNDRQMDLMRRHPLIGARVLSGTQFLEMVIPGVRSHHERFDGSGYPDKLAGRAIPLTARIVAVADSFDAITSARSFRGATDGRNAAAIIRSAAGTQLDPDLVTIFLRQVDKLGDSLLEADTPQAPDAETLPPAEVMSSGPA